MNHKNDDKQAASPDIDAPRNYKKINVPFNEYEFGRLEKAAQKSGRSKLNFIRRAILEAAKNLDSSK